MRKEFILLGSAVIWLLVRLRALPLSNLLYERGIASLVGLFVAYVAIRSLSLKYQPHILVVIALIYQPFLRIKMSDDLWNIVDIITAVYMIWLIVRIKFSDFFELAVFPNVRKHKVALCTVGLVLLGMHMLCSIYKYGKYWEYYYCWLTDSYFPFIMFGIFYVCLEELQPKK